MKLTPCLQGVFLQGILIHALYLVKNDLKSLWCAR